LLHALQPSARGRPSRQPYWKERSTAVSRKSKLRCFQIGEYLNHCVIIMVFLWSSYTYDPHINNSGQDSLTKTFFELQFRSRLEASAGSYRTASQYPEITVVLFSIKTTKQSLIKSCLRWLPSHIGSITGHVINFIKAKLSFLASYISYACSSLNHRQQQ